MFPYTNIFGLNVSTYGIFAAAGILLSFVVIVLYVRKLKIDEKEKADYTLAVLFGSLGALIGSKLLYIITIFPQFVSDLTTWGREDPAGFFAVYMNEGFVFFGGFYGAVIAMLLYSKLSKFSVGKIINSVLPALPLGHAIGRIGCFSAGCCYGLETDSPISITFTHSELAPNNVPLIPVQLYEAAGNILIFIILIILRKKNMEPMKLLGTYMLLYGVLRFTDEFFRGDMYRGFVGPLSTSQIFSIINLIVGTILIFYRKRKQPVLDSLHQNG